MSKIEEIGNSINHKNNDDYEDMNFLGSITSYREKPLERFANVAFWAMTLGASVALASSLFIINPIILAGTFVAVSTVVGGTTLAATSKAEKLKNLTLLTYSHPPSGNFPLYSQILVFCDTLLSASHFINLSSIWLKSSFGSKGIFPLIWVRRLVATV